jgi:hypothetical protein
VQFSACISHAYRTGAMKQSKNICQIYLRGIGTPRDPVSISHTVVSVLDCSRTVEIRAMEPTRILSEQTFSAVALSRRGYEGWRSLPGHPAGFISQILSMLLNSFDPIAIHVHPRLIDAPPARPQNILATPFAQLKPYPVGL